ncbi:porin [Proteiniphilum sp. X52]|uniref:porin n=1 Tax=Proteiniphilum sp. X52 TaxID=2382159 RepID=UPI000F0A8152|nr:porin [Proteiniphilum sp. X52]RNC66145.1 porin [Proteiniphilum sp. X52]
MEHFFIVMLMVGFSFYSSATPMVNMEEDKVVEKNTQQQSEIAVVLAKLPKISGYLQTGWNYSTAGEGTSSFQAKRLRLLVDGTVTPNLAFRLQIEAFNGIPGSLTPNGQKNLQVMDAFATYTFSPAFKVRAGQYYLPLGYENYDISPATLETVDFSNIVYRMVCRNPYEYNFVDYGRDLGVMIMGDLFPSEKDFNHLSYDLSLSNGSLPMKDDPNKSKDVVAAITVRPIKYFNVKASHGWGEYTYTDGEGKRSLYNTMNRTILGAWYNDPNGVFLRAEYGFLKGENGMFDERGFYALAGYNLQTKYGKLLPLIRYDRYEDKANDMTANNYDRILAGFTFQPAPNLKIQLNYQHGFYSAKASQALGRDGYDQVQLMGLFRF